MKKLHSSREFKWLKTLHVFSACMWGGAAVALVMVQLCIHPVTGDELHLRDLCMKVIDDYVVIPGAFGCLLTGFVYAMLTKWGFFKYRWVTIKWILNISFILFGAIYFVPWVDRAEAISNMQRLTALQDAEYLHSRFISEGMAIFQLIALFGIVTLSVFKPWMKKKSSTSQ